MMQEVPTDLERLPADFARRNGDVTDTVLWRGRDTLFVRPDGAPVQVILGTGDHAPTIVIARNDGRFPVDAEFVLVHSSVDNDSGHFGWVGLGGRFSDIVRLGPSAPELALPANSDNHCFVRLEADGLRIVDYSREGTVVRAAPNEVD